MILNIFGKFGNAEHFASSCEITQIIERETKSFYGYRSSSQITAAVI